MPRRSSWMSTTAAALGEELARIGLTVPTDQLEILLTERVAAVAVQMHITERTARQYFDHDTLRTLARDLALIIKDEAPGADLLALPRTAVMPLATLGATIAALVEGRRPRWRRQGSRRVGNGDGTDLHARRPGQRPRRGPPRRPGARATPHASGAAHREHRRPRTPRLPTTARRRRRRPTPPAEDTPRRRCRAPGTDPQHRPTVRSGLWAVPDDPS